MLIGGAVRGRRTAIGTLLILTPVLVPIGLGLPGVLLGSMGMDIHPHSKAAFYVAITCSILLLWLRHGWHPVAKESKNLKVNLQKSDFQGAASVVREIDGYPLLLAELSSAVTMG